MKIVGEIRRRGAVFTNHSCCESTIIIPLFFGTALYLELDCGNYQLLKRCTKRRCINLLVRYRPAPSTVVLRNSFFTKAVSESWQHNLPAKCTQ